MSGKLTLAGQQCDVYGYEIHCGHSQGNALNQPLISELSTGTTGIDGFISARDELAKALMQLSK